MYHSNCDLILSLQIFSSAGRSQVGVNHEALLPFPIRHFLGSPKARVMIVDLPMLILPSSESGLKGSADMMDKLLVKRVNERFIK